MRKWYTNSDIQTAGFEVLANATNEHPTIPMIKNSIVDAQGVTVVMDAQWNYPNNTHLQQLGETIMMNLAGGDDAIQVKHKPTDKDCELTKNLVPPNLSGVSSFAQLCLCDLQSHDKIVVEKSLKAFANMCSIKNVNRVANCQGIVKASGFCMVLGAMRKWLTNSDIQTAGFEVLANATNEHPTIPMIKNSIVDAQGVTVVMDALWNFPNNTHLQQLGETIMMNLAGGDGLLV